MKWGPSLTEGKARAFAEGVREGRRQAVDRELLKRVAEAVRDECFAVYVDGRTGPYLDDVIDRVLGEAEAQQPEADHHECIWRLFASDREAAAHARGVASGWAAAADVIAALPPETTQWAVLKAVTIAASRAAQEVDRG